MDEVTIVFLDGTSLSADHNGDCFIVDRKPDFPADLSLVRVEGETTHCVYHNAVLIECASTDGRYWFAFTEENEETVRLRKMQENIQVIAEITDVDLEAPDPTSELSLKERINDLEIAVCELMDGLA